ncbi:MAG: O-acetyltransferase OatA [Pseudomonas citronellolis]|nr:MAG: O-acetyltransferase OatA [Pseudomonas citronellolis]
MGVYRLVLAMLVAVSHLGVTFWSLNPGVIAVVSFLLISGFVMTSLIDRHYRRPNRLPLFYLDRLMRLYPQFLFYLVISCLLIYHYLPGTPQAAELTPGNIAANLAMLPLGFYMFNFSGTLLLPPAWSLGLEVSFYLLIPLLLIFRCRGIAFALSVGVSLCALLGFIDTDIYGYRLLPGMLFIFLCGSLMYRMRRRGAWLVAATTVLAALLCLAILCGGIARRPFNAEITAGVALGVPVLYLLTKLRYHWFDEWLGNISYGVFLNHYVVMYGLRIFWPSQAGNVALVLGLALLGSLFSYICIERPVLRLRHALRAGRRPAVSGGTAEPLGN